MPDLAAKYGDFTVAVVIAHEWGHAVQHRAEIDQPTVVLELQADCFAGAWTRHVTSSGTSRFEAGTRELDESLAGILSFRDAPGPVPRIPTLTDRGSTGWRRSRLATRRVPVGAGHSRWVTPGPTSFSSKEMTATPRETLIWQ